MERSRLKKLTSRTLACALLSGALVAGYGTSSQAGHADCGLEPTPDRNAHVKEGAFGAHVEYGQSEDRPYVGVFTGQGTFVVADGDTSGARVYGTTDATRPAFESRHWFKVGVDDGGNVRTCSKPH